MIPQSVFLLFYYFRNFEESEDELRNEVVESLEKLATFNEAEKREEVSSSSKDAGNLEETEGIGMQKYSELNEGLESIFIPSDDKICIGDEDQGASTNSQNIQLWLLNFFLNDVCMCYSISLGTSHKYSFIVRVFQ